MTKVMTLDELKTLITDHNLTYELFSNDYMTWEKGNQEYKVIKIHYELLTSNEDKEKIIDHWNLTVKEKVNSDMHDMFIWEK